MTSWLLLAATLPAQPSALRVRVWRALKATGAGLLRDGVYLLPAEAPTAPALRALAETISAADAEAHLLEVDARDEAQARAFRSLFDRSEAHAELQAAVQEARGAMRAASAAGAARSLRQLEQQLVALRALDFFPGDGLPRSEAALAGLRQAVARQGSPDEPTPARRRVERLDPAAFQGRTWATRRRPWMDRLATAWLVQRFIDRSPRFLWLADARDCPEDALGYDFDGARFTHVDDLVTVEVVARSFGLDADPGIARLAAIVHGIDVGGPPAEEAAGLEAVMRGLQRLHPQDDDALLAAARPVFDALHAALGAAP